MNDINSISSKFDFILYPDGTTMFSSMCIFTSYRRDTAYIAININKESSKLSHWLAVNKISLNISKTKFIQFHLIYKIYLKYSVQSSTTGIEM